MSIMQRINRQLSSALLFLPALVFAASFSVKAQQLPPPGNININKADVALLSQLSGISRKRAEAIIDYRKKHGAFKAVDDLSRVKGIGKGFVKRHRQQLRVG